MTRDTQTQRGSDVDDSPDGDDETTSHPPRDPSALAKKAPAEPSWMADWIRLGAEALSVMVAEQAPVTLASFARRLEAHRHAAAGEAREMTIRWVWQSLLAHPTLSEQLRRHHDEALHGQSIELEILPPRSLLAIRLSPAPGLKRRDGRGIGLPDHQWALVELTEPLKFVGGNRARMRCAESKCRVAYRPRPTPPRQKTDSDLRAWARLLDPPRIEDCDSLNEAAQQASVAIEHFRRTHTNNVFTTAYWLRDEATVVSLDELRDRIEYEGQSSMQAFARAEPENVTIDGLDELLHTLGRRRPIETLSQLLALPSAKVGAGMAVRGADRHDVEVVERTPEGTLRGRLSASASGTPEEVELPVWLFDEVRRSDGRWVAIALSDRELRMRQAHAATEKRR